MPDPRVQIEHFTIGELRIPFKRAFRHAAADRAETSSVWVRATTSHGVVGHGESCPRPYVTGETIESARAFAGRHESEVRRQIVGVDSLLEWVAGHASELDENPAAWCAMELAILDVLGRESARTVEHLLAVAPLDGTFRYTAVLGEAGVEAFKAVAEEYRRRGFRDFKVKLSGDNDQDGAKVDVFRQWPSASTLRVRVDANNLWGKAGDAIAALSRLDYPFFAVEEPIRANQYADLARLGERLGCKVILDESFLRIAQLADLTDPADRWLVNIRVSKMGGLVRSLKILEAASARGIGVIVGAQVGETSLLTRAALTVARAAGPALVAQEGAFGTLLLEHDICTPVLMFGHEGLLETAVYPALQEPGLGLSCRHEDQ